MTYNIVKVAHKDDYNAVQNKYQGAEECGWFFKEDPDNTFCRPSVTSFGIIYLLADSMSQSIHRWTCQSNETQCKSKCKGVNQVTL